MRTINTSKFGPILAFPKLIGTEIFCYRAMSRITLGGFVSLLVLFAADYATAAPTTVHDLNGISFRKKQVVCFKRKNRTLTGYRRKNGRIKPLRMNLRSTRKLSRKKRTSLRRQQRLLRQVCRGIGTRAIVQSTNFDIPTLPESIYWCGDTNCDGKINNLDIEPFLTAISNLDNYLTTYPECSPASADCNCDGSLNSEDIETFTLVVMGSASGECVVPGDANPWPTPPADPDGAQELECGNGWCDPSEDLLSCPEDCFDVKPFTNTIDVFMNESAELQLAEFNQCTPESISITALPTYGVVKADGYTLTPEDLPFPISGEIVYQPNLDFLWFDSWSFIENGPPVLDTLIVQRGRMEETLYIRVVDRDPTRVEKTYIPPITESRWTTQTKKDLETLNPAEITKDDYLAYFNNYYSPRQSLFRGYLDSPNREDNRSHADTSIFEAFLYYLEDDPEIKQEHLEYVLEYFRADYEFLTSDVDPDTIGFERTLSPLVSWDLIKNDPYFSSPQAASDLVFLEEYFRTIDDVAGRELGAHNRSLARAKFADHLATMFPSNPNAREQAGYAAYVWNLWWEPRESHENSNNYDVNAFESVDRWVESLGPTHMVYQSGELPLGTLIYEDPEYKSCFDDLLSIIPPNGALIPGYGDTVGMNTNPGTWIVALERRAAALNDGTYKWYAHRLFTHFNDNLEAIKQWGNPELSFALKMVEAYIAADDSIAEVEPAFTTKLTTRKMYDYDFVGHTYSLTDEIVPNKLILSSTPTAVNRRDSMFAVFEVSPQRFGHGHCDTGSLLHLSKEQAVLANNPGYLLKLPQFHNTFVTAKEGELSRCDLEEYLHVSQVEVPVVADFFTTTYADIDITNHNANTAFDLNREVVMAKNQFLWIRDTLQVKESTSASIGPAYQTLAAYGQKGVDFINTAYPTVPVARIYPEELEDLNRYAYKYLMQWPNNPQDLLIIFPSLEGSLEFEPINPAYSQVINSYLPNTNNYRVWQKDEATLLSGDVRQFHSILYPHDPTPLTARLRDKFELIEHRGAGGNVDELRFEDGSYYLMVPEYTVIEGASRALKQPFTASFGNHTISTDASALHLRVIDPVLFFEASAATFLRVNDDVVFEETGEANREGQYFLPPDWLP